MSFYAKDHEITSVCVTVKKITSVMIEDEDEQKCL
jgi:hypothetical protein